MVIPSHEFLFTTERGYATIYKMINEPSFYDGK